ncbi:MAG: zf-HC2 domain-containing protein [Pseudomonadota bacterium]
MVHEEIKDTLPDYLKGALPDEVRVEIEKHVAGCRDCTHELALLSDLLGVEAQDPGTLFWDTLSRRIGVHAGEAARSRPRNWFLQPLPIALVASFFAVAVLFYSKTTTDQVGSRSEPALEVNLNGDEEIVEIAEELSEDTNGSEDDLEDCSAELALLDMKELDTLSAMLGPVTK